MQAEPQVGWDITTVSVHYDLTTKLTVCFLAMSIIVLSLRSIKFLVTFWRLKTSAAVVRRGRNASTDRSEEAGPAIRHAEQQFNKARSAIEIAQISISRWSWLTFLILLLYSTTELAWLLSLISREKMIGTSALSGSLANIFNMWTVGLWFLVALSIANWILANRLEHCREG